MTRNVGKFRNIFTPRSSPDPKTFEFFKGSGMFSWPLKLILSVRSRGEQSSDNQRWWSHFLWFLEGKNIYPQIKFINRVLNKMKFMPTYQKMSPHLCTHQKMSQLYKGVPSKFKKKIIKLCQVANFIETGPFGAPNLKNIWFMSILVIFCMVWFVGIF